jgi:transposase
VTAGWEAELLRVIELDPHEVGQETANWTSGLLAVYLGEKTGIKVSLETVRTSLHALGYVCKRPTWTDPPQSRSASGFRGKREAR